MVQLPLAGVTAQALVQGLRYVLHLKRSHALTIARPPAHPAKSSCAGGNHPPVQRGGHRGPDPDRPRQLPLSNMVERGPGGEACPAHSMARSQPALPPHARRNSAAVGKLVPET